MEESFWHERWQAGRIGFHLGEVNPNLVAQHDAWLGRAGVDPQTASDARVLVPLCGKSEDLAWLAAAGHEVVGVEFIESAARTFFEEHELPFEIEPGSRGPTLRAAGIAIVVGDFFACTEEDIPRCSLAYDRAALVAVAPELRKRYAQQLSRLLVPGGGLLLVSFEHDLESGPPFSVPPDEVRALFGGSFELDLVDEHDILASEPRFAERGASIMREQVYLGRRRA